MQTRGKLIAVDFAARRRLSLPPAPPRLLKPQPTRQRRSLQAADEFVVLWRPPARREAAEYLGGRWDWGWTLFVWTSEAAVGSQWTRIVAGRGYVPQHLTREAFVSFLHRASEIGGLLIDGELEGAGEIIRAEPEQLIRRDQAIQALGG
ncbi:MAG TPA: hypothetical protein VNO26_14475 [Candidatus Limnocylindria bacterium]|nr:hypothetical protein [Candidatus Limnocylindria bacterium]